MATQLKKLSILMIIIFLLVGCNKYYSPDRAARTGGKKCGGRSSMR